MICPNCGRKDGNGKVIDSRPFHHTIRRRRECTLCGHRWNTVEVNTETAEFYEKQIERIKELEHTILTLTSTTKGWIGKWTDAEDEQLITLYREGHQYRKIAQIMKRRYKGIESRITKLRKEGRLYEGK